MTNTKMSKPTQMPSLQLSDIDTTPVVQSAPPAAEVLLETLAKTMFSPKLYVGQNIGNSNYHLAQNYEASVMELKEETGKVPAILSVDYVWEEALEDYSETNAVLDRHFDEGGIVLVSIHPGNPFLGGGIYTKGTGDYKFDDLFKPGTKPYVAWQRMLKRIADGLKLLEKDNNIVLWRPLHEMNGAWFWWGGGDAEQITPAEYKKLWMSIYTYFGERKLNNLLWVYSPSSNHDETSTIGVLDLYPGDEFVDIIGLDYYYDTFDHLDTNGSVSKLVAQRKPFGFAELGPQGRKKIDNLDVLEVVKKKFPQTAFVIHWHTNTDKMFAVPWSIIDGYNADKYLKDERAITLDQRKVK